MRHPANATAARGGVATRPRGRLFRREALEFHLYILPWLIGFLGLTLGPLIYSLVITFTDVRMFGTWEFVGLKNYREMLVEDPLFWKSLMNTAYYAFTSVPLGLIVAFALASLLNMKLRGIALFRTIFYLPSVTAGVAVIMLWGWIFNPSFGLLNYGLSLLGIEGPAWLGDPRWAMPALVIMSLWGVGGPMLIFLAALQDIPQDLYESASIDGASRWVQVFHITLPMISPIILFNMVLGFIGAFQVFTQAFVLTQGGPLNATYVFLLHLFNNAFRYGRMAYGSALAWVLFVVILIFTLILMATSKWWVFYMGERGDGR